MGVDKNIRASETVKRLSEQDQEKVTSLAESIVKIGKASKEDGTIFLLSVLLVKEYMEDMLGITKLKDKNV